MRIFVSFIAIISLFISCGSKPVKHRFIAAEELNLKGNIESVTTRYTPVISIENYDVDTLADKRMPKSVKYQFENNKVSDIWTQMGDEYGEDQIFHTRFFIDSVDSDIYSRVYRANGNLLSESVIQHISDDSLILKVISKRQESAEMFYYNEKGFIEKRVIKQPMMLFEESTFYNEQNDIISVKRIMLNEGIDYPHDFNCKYLAFDEMNNWTKRIFYNGGDKPEYVIEERTVTYLK